MLEIKGFSNELRTLFFEELVKLIEKFIRVTPQEQDEIKQVMDILERLKIQGERDADLETLLKISRFLKEYTIETVEFYLWCTSTLGKSMTIQEADEYIMKIEANGYVELNEMLIYEEGAYLEEYIEQILKNELLTDVYHIKRLIDIDEIVEMWLNGDNVNDMVDELKRCDLSELLENPVEQAYITVNNKVMMYVEKDC